MNKALLKAKIEILRAAVNILNDLERSLENIDRQLFWDNGTLDEIEDAGQSATNALERLEAVLSREPASV